MSYRDAWLRERRERLSSVIEFLTANPGSLDDLEWQQRVAEGSAGILAELGAELQRNGTLPGSKAMLVVIAIHGVRSPENSEKWDKLADLIREEFQS